MSLPWHIPLEAIPKQKLSHTIYPTITKHYSNINIKTVPNAEVRTGLMCDIGQMNKDPKSIQRLIAAGMTIARVNISSMDTDSAQQLIQAIRQAVYNYSTELNYVYPLAIIADVKAPQLTTGNLKAGANAAVELLEYSTVRLTTDAAWRDCGTADCIYVGWNSLTDLQKDDVLFIDSINATKIKLIVEETGSKSIDCTVAIGGFIGNRMPVRVQCVPLDIESKTADSNLSLTCCGKEEGSAEHFHTVAQQVNWIVGADLDAILMTNTQTVNDILELKEMLKDKGKHVLIIASIETILGLENIDEILVHSDGIFFDRCNIATDMQIEKLFVAQKMIVAKCNEIGKPSICHAVVNEQIPNLCVSDIANLVLDGADVLYLEIDYNSPLTKVLSTFDSIRMAEHCIAAASVICRQAENIAWRPFGYGNLDLMSKVLKNPVEAVCVNAVDLAARSRAVVIICLTNSGQTAMTLSHVHPPCPILAVTRVCHTARCLRFWKGCRSLHYFQDPKENYSAEVDAKIKTALDYCKAKKILEAGDPYVVIHATRKDTGYCDAVKLLFASLRDIVYT